MADTRRRVVLFKGLAAALLFIAAIFWGCPSDQPIKIGFVAGTSGRVADLGISGRDAAELAIDQVNQNGGTVSVAIGFEAAGAQTFLDIAREQLAVESDGILVIANSMDSALICQQIRKLDAHIPITLADWGATERLLELGGQAVEGVTVVQTFDRDSQAPRYQAFRKAYMERYRREPGFPGVYTYDALQVLLTALRRQKDGQDLKDTILSIGTFQGLQSEFSFDAFGDVNRPHASISVVRNREFVILE